MTDEKKNTFTVLNLNVFPGSPLPFICNGTRSLASTRLYDQIDQIRLYDPDIISLQELYCDHSRQKYIETFSSIGYHYLNGERNTTIGKVLCLLIHVLTTSICFMFFHIILFDMILISIFVSCVSSFMIWRQSALTSWLAGNSSGLMMFWKRSLFHLKNDIDIIDSQFEHQRGDWMNSIAPRSFIRIKLYMNINMIPLVIINTHINALGDSKDRDKQLKEITRIFCDDESIILCGDFNTNDTSEEMISFVNDTKLVDAGPQSPTWSRQNPFTRGWMRVDDMRCDYVMFRSSRNEKDFTLMMRQSEIVFNKKPFVSDHFGILSTFCVNDHHI